MTPLERLHVVGPADRASEALDRLARHGVNRLPVVQDGRLLGLVTRPDILKWLVLHDQTGPHPRGEAGKPPSTGLRVFPAGGSRV